AAADGVDLRLLARAEGPLLDVGCGPGRMVRAARDLGLEAWGLDISAAAVEHAREQGIPVLLGSVFDRLPVEKGWGTVLLIDGNIGIGGHVSQLLRRCRRLLARDGVVLVELHGDDARDHRFQGHLVDADGRESGVFPWAEIGLSALVPQAERAGLQVSQDWVDGDRVFCTLRAIAR
ncbi:MAG: class I SAM-dependent methyltransferase, partial [Micrococcales bacterium]|nr:class I SAM-dependent methyltransferase [Micrococcales bacterium]